MCEPHMMEGFIHNPIPNPNESIASITLPKAEPSDNVRVSSIRVVLDQPHVFLLVSPI